MNRFSWSNVHTRLHIDPTKHSKHLWFVYVFKPTLPCLYSIVIFYFTILTSKIYTITSFDILLLTHIIPLYQQSTVNSTLTKKRHYTIYTYPSHYPSNNETGWKRRDSILSALTPVAACVSSVFFTHATIAICICQHC